MPPATAGRDDTAWGALPDSSEAKEFAAYLMQNGHHEAAGEFSRAGCAVSALIFVTALLVLHAILLTVR